jgi:hypothetical protein
MLNKNQEGDIPVVFVTLVDALHPERGTGMASAIATPSAPVMDGALGNSHPNVAVVVLDGDEQHNSVADSASSPCSGANFIEIVVGSSMVISAVAATYGMELSGAVVYILAAAFYNFAQKTKKCIGILPAMVFFIVAWVMMLVDGILLGLSVMISELLAMIANMLCALFGGCSKGPIWHQYVRKRCHYARWSFRNFHESWEPKRKFPFDKTEIETPVPNNDVVAPRSPPKAQARGKEGSQKNSEFVVAHNVVMDEM